MIKILLGFVFTGLLVGQVVKDNTGVTVVGPITYQNGAGTQECLHRNTLGVISGTGTDCASSSGTVNSGLINQLGIYSTSGTAISGLNTGNSGVLVTDSSGVPSISSTLPSGVNLGTSGKIGNVTLSTLSGIGFWTAGVPSIAVASNVQSLFTGCTAGTILPGSGTACLSPSTTFSVLTSGTNTTAAMVVGSGATFQSNVGVLLGGATSSFPMLDNSGATARIRKADQSGDADLTVAKMTASDNVQAGTNNTFQWQTSRSRMRSETDGYITLLNSAETGFTLLRLGGTTSSFPGWKRSGTLIAARLADDSADAPISASMFRGITCLFANLATCAPNNGDSGYSSDSQPTSGADDTCAGGGTGAGFRRLNGVYRCQQ